MTSCPEGVSEPPFDTTWDGLHIAGDRPQGSAVVVRRWAPAGWEYLLLHRAAKGPDFTGDWAWTSPAGCRQPGEAVYPAALRELGEEAGLTGLVPWAVDLSAGWAVFAVTVPPDAGVVLLDPEHDRFEWLAAAAALARVAPAHVGQIQIAALEQIPEVTFDFRRMRREDLPAYVAWQRAPHAARWFHAETLTLEEAERHCRPAIDGEDPTRMWVVQADGRAVGMVQDYCVGDHESYATATGDPQAIGFDYLLGDPGLTGRGLGTRMLWTYLTQVVLPAYPAAPRLLASPDHRNGLSLRVLDKLGFTRGKLIEVSEDGRVDTELVCTIDVQHWWGRPAGIAENL